MVLLLVACSTPAPPGPQLAGPPSPDSPDEARPDVLVVVIDTLRADRTFIGGNSRMAGSQLAALAASGVTYLDTTAPGSWTWPSHASLFTGEPPWVHGAHFSPDPSHAIAMDHNRLAMSPMRTDLPTLAERFGAAGYRTVALFENTFLDPALGLTRGFTRAEPHPKDLVPQALAAMQGDDPLFLFVNLMAPHAPYEVRPLPWVLPHRERMKEGRAPGWILPYLSPSGVDLTRGNELRGWDLYARGDLVIPPEDMAMLLDLYDGEVAAADHQLSQLVKGWGAAGRSGIVVATSDHGEYFGEHGLMEHGRTVWREVTHVPLVVVAPGRVPAGRVVNTPVQLQDVYPTVLELAGLMDPAWSLVDAMEGHPRPHPIQAEEWTDLYKANVAPVYRTGWRLYREGALALVYATDGTRTELYDVAADPRMATDLTATRVSDAQRLAAAARDAFPAYVSGPGVRADLSPESIQVLEAMGYLDPGPPALPAAPAPPTVPPSAP